MPVGTYAANMLATAIDFGLAAAQQRAGKVNSAVLFALIVCVSVSCCLDPLSACLVCWVATCCLSMSRRECGVPCCLPGLRLHQLLGHALDWRGADGIQWSAQHGVHARCGGESWERPCPKYHNAQCDGLMCAYDRQVYQRRVGDRGQSRICSRNGMLPHDFICSVQASARNY